MFWIIYAIIALLSLIVMMVLAGIEPHFWEKDQFNIYYITVRDVIRAVIIAIIPVVNLFAVVCGTAEIVDRLELGDSFLSKPVFKKKNE